MAAVPQDFHVCGSTSMMTRIGAGSCFVASRKIIENGVVKYDIATVLFTFDSGRFSAYSDVHLSMSVCILYVARSV